MDAADDEHTVDEFGEIDPEEAPSSRRRRWWPIAAAAVVVAIAAGLLAWRPWSATDSAPATTAARLTEELVIDLPGLTLDRSLEGPSDPLREFLMDGFVFASPTADLEEGPLLVFLVADIDDREEFESGDASVEINGRPATIEENEGSIEIYWEGEPGVRYGVAGEGVPRARVIAFAEAVSFENDVTVVDDPTVVAGLEPAGDVATLFAILGMTQPLYRTGAPEVPPVQEYLSAGGEMVSLASISAPDQFIGLAALVMTDEQFLDVDGSSVIIGTLPPSFFDGDGRRMLLAVRGGRLIGITGVLNDDELLEVLAAVRAATDEEWATVLAAVVDPFEEFEVNEGG